MPDSQPPTQMPSPVFVTTRWTRVLAAGGDAPGAKAALSELCEAYWTPVFRFLRRERDEERARELTQEFFSRILSRGGIGGADPARGRFRSFLLGAVKHFLADVRDHENRLKRGGGAIHESLDAPAIAGPDEGGAAFGGVEIEDHGAGVSDTYFDRQWALALMDRALGLLQQEFVADGKQAQFDGLKPWLVGDAAGGSQAEIAARLGMSEGSVKVAIHRLRKRFRDVLRDEIAQTVGDPGAVDGELRYLVEVLAAGG